MPEPCPLCSSKETGFYHRDRRRDYHHCGVCDLVFVPRAFYLSVADEKAEYDKHDNAVDDPGYRRFLSRLFDPLVERLKPGSRGLDFGCGPGPALAAMFNDANFPTDVYDLFYAPDDSVWRKRYDFISATEVVEHLHRPGDVLNRLWQQLQPGGWLGLMTKRVIDREAFARWHYKNDPTHVCFFSEASFQWLANHWDARVMFVGADVALLQKKTKRQ